MDVGRTVELPVWVVGEAGALLGGRDDHVLLPASEVPPGTAKGDRLRVFVYTDTNDERVATLRKPAAQVGELVVLEVVDRTPHGVFCAFGLPKDLFVPWANQHRRLMVGDRAVVYVGVDGKGRLVGHTKLGEILVAPTRDLRVGQEVELLVYGFNEIGALVAVDGTHTGLVYRDQLQRRVRVGDRLTGWIAKVRDDGKLDVSPVPLGRRGQEHAADIVLEALERDGGFLPLTDDSPPDEIRRRLGLSKKAFKRGVGALYKQRQVEIEADGIRLRRR